MVRYNITSNDGERSSVTVFIGSEMLVAAKEHNNFPRICEFLGELSKSYGPDVPADEVETLRGLFDVSVPISKKFNTVSERVSINAGRVFFDLVAVDNAVSQAIMRFYAEDKDFMPLVNFMEKIEQNPNPHSREHLYRWLRDRHFSLCLDGDFIAYKGVRGTLKSVTSGDAVVNGETTKGYIPNEPGTVIEMARDQVTFDPSQGCSRGLHAGNWSYAQDFAQGAVLSVKINPRDVVSVPTDSSDQKLRVCRYRVVGQVTSESKESLLPLDLLRTVKVTVQEEAESKKKVQSKKQKVQEETKWPEFYEQFNKKHWVACTTKDIAWILREWEVSPIPKTKAEMVEVANKEARKRRRQLAL